MINKTTLPSENIVEAAVSEKIKKCLAMAQSKLGYTISNPLQIRYSLKRRVAGKCVIKIRGMISGTIGARAQHFCRLSFHMGLARANLEDFLSRTVPHEIAHLIEWVTYGYMSHGYNFQRIMREVLEVPVQHCGRTHNYDVQAATDAGLVRKVAIFDYKCPKCGKTYKLTQIKHNKQIRKGGQWYCCRLCREYIVRA